MITAVSLHVLLSLTHGVTHVGIPVPTLPWQGAYAGSVFVTLPIVGLAMLSPGTPDSVVDSSSSQDLPNAFEGLLHFPSRTWITSPPSPRARGCAPRR